MKKDVPAKLEEVANIRDEVMQKLREKIQDENISDFDFFKARLVLEEVLANARKYGSNHDPNRQFQVAVKWQRGKFIVDVTDQSGSFYHPTDAEHVGNSMRFQSKGDLSDHDVLRARRKDARHDPERGEGDGGLGIHLVLETMKGKDSVQYKSAKTGKTVTGTHVVLTWDLAARKK